MVSLFGTARLLGRRKTSLRDLLKRICADMSSSSSSFSSAPPGKRLRVLVDMDGEKAISIWESKDFFVELEPLPGAVEAVKEMAQMDRTGTEPTSVGQEEREGRDNVPMVTGNS
ncbi:5'(3')-deoxyribonucleotidase, mitochondrial [Liparis tanakae]|uniref:5'(3')-deoxyribonucleotidase, mitochondrial n=1 Tax=Liparis tanakae TaxID=230148 RepID=A0A4Z2FPH4_9TELE|nr:5'(3')-deoxyribonucleotidase, mitochondrial [Liparis tanakae]